MKILISSYAFAPSFGGLETVTRLLAHEFAALGHEITVITQTPGATDPALPFAVVRRPGAGVVRRLVAQCDLFWHNNLSVRTLWPAIWSGKPVVITHQGSYCARPRGLDLALRLKHAVVRRYPSVAISHAVARCFDTRSIVIPNPYDAATFFVGPNVTRTKDFIFVGRLVTEKGVDLLLQAFARVLPRNPHLQLTIVGDGPELTRLQELSRQHGIAQSITFAGAAAPSAIAEQLNRHRVLVVPSRYDEPFGVVALEGIGCGCAVVGSSGGGLPEAIGPCGITVPNNDVDSLARTLEEFARDPSRAAAFTASAATHLERFHPRVIAKSYLDLFNSLT